jgi:Asp/Glu/hydantoin racemase
VVGEPHGPVRGGKAVYGAAVGILMLEARFPRIPGDVGNALTWSFPVLYRVVKDASPERVVRGRADGLLPAFVEAARELVATGADGIVSNCGFLSVLQREIAAAVPVPVALSSLQQAALTQAVLPAGRRVGILTISRASLSADHLAAAGVPPDIPLEGADEGRELTRAILGNEPELDVEAARADVLEAGERLRRRHPEVGAFVLECTNMGPYAGALAKATGLPVFDMTSFVRWFHNGLRPHDYPPRPAEAWE